jgi:hypothetical protein
MALQHLRSGTANKRPLPTAMSDGQLAVNTNLASPGLFFKDGNGDLVKVGPVHIGSAAPNVSPASTAATALVANTIYKVLTVGTSDFTAVGAGSNAVGVVFTASGTTTGTGTVSGEQGNEKGEMWLDNTGGAYDLKIYDGTAWRSQAGEFVNATGDTMTGNLIFNNANVVFEGSAADDHETTLTVVNPTADRTITLPNVTGTVVTTGDTGTVTSTMITDGTIVNADVNASAAIAGTKVSPNFGSQAITTTGIINANGKVSFPLGSATAPSLLPGSDANTGIFSPGADQIAIATNGEQRVSIGASGQVLIGADTTLSGAAQRQLMLVTQGGGQLALARNDSSTSAGNHIGELVFFGKGGGAYERCGRIAVEADLDHASGDKPSRMVFETTGDGDGNPTVRMNIDSSGRVGIGGTPAAGTLLHVTGSGGAVQINNVGDTITFTKGGDNTITSPAANSNLKYIAHSSGTHYFSGSRVEIVGPTDLYVSNGSNTADGVLIQPTVSTFFGDTIMQASGIYTRNNSTISSVAGMFVGGVKGITDSAIKTSLLPNGRIDAGGLTVDLNLTPASGTSVELFYGGSGGVIQAYDRDNSNLEPLQVRGSTWAIEHSGTATFGSGYKVGIRPFDGDSADQLFVDKANGTRTFSVLGSGSATFKGQVKCQDASGNAQLVIGTLNSAIYATDSIFLQPGGTTSATFASNGSVTFVGGIETQSFLSVKTDTANANYNVLGVTWNGGSGSTYTSRAEISASGAATFKGQVNCSSDGNNVASLVSNGYVQSDRTAGTSSVFEGQLNGTSKVSIIASGAATFADRVDAGALTVDSNLTPTSGTSIEHFYSPNGGIIQAYDRTNGNLEPLQVRGSTWALALDGSASFAGGEVTINAAGNAAGKFNIDSTPDGGNSAWGLSVKNNDGRSGRPTLKLRNVGGGNAVEIANSGDTAVTTVITTAGAAAFSGTVSAQGSVLTSDQRFKENITDAKSQLADVTALGNKLRNWDWTADAPVADKDTRFLGLVAQEAETICPGIVTTIARTKDGDELTPEVVVPAVYETKTVPAVLDDEGEVVEAETTEQVLVTEEQITPATYEQLDDSYKGIKNDILIMKLLGAVAELSAKVAALEAG